MDKGYFIAIEGVDCSGKSTMVPYLAEQLRTKGFDVVVTREPGGSPLGEKIRKLLLEEKMDPITELLLFAAQRNEHVNKTILPALESNKVVITDRFCYSSRSYQGYGRGLLHTVLKLEDLVHKDFFPDITLFFDVELEESFKRLDYRAQQAGKDRFEVEDLEFKTDVYHGYKSCYYNNFASMYRIDANKNIEEVKAQIDNWVDEFSNNQKNQYLRKVTNETISWNFKKDRRRRPTLPR